MKHLLTLWLISGHGSLYLISDPSTSFSIIDFCYSNAAENELYEVSRLENASTTHILSFKCYTEDSGRFTYQIVND